MVYTRTTVSNPAMANMTPNDPAYSTKVIIDISPEEEITYGTDQEAKNVSGFDNFALYGPGFFGPAV